MEIIIAVDILIDQIGFKTRYLAMTCHLNQFVDGKGIVGSPKGIDQSLKLVAC